MAMYEYMLPILIILLRSTLSFGDDSLDGQVVVISNGNGTNPPVDPDTGDPILCPRNIPIFMPNDYKLHCATVYKKENCQGDALYIPHNHSSPILDPEWNRAISSVTISATCTLKLCNLRHFQGDCYNLTGANKAEVFYYLGVHDNDAASLACVCGGGSVEKISQAPPMRFGVMPSDDDWMEMSDECGFTLDRYAMNDRCATLFTKNRCKGRQFEIRNNLQDTLMEGEFKNGIGSITFNSNSILTLCRQRADLTKQCRNFTSKDPSEEKYVAYPTMPFGYSASILSASCITATRAKEDTGLGKNTGSEKQNTNSKNTGSEKQNTNPKNTGAGKQNTSAASTVQGWSLIWVAVIIPSMLML